MKTGKGDDVHGELAKIRVQLSGKSERACDSGHDGRNEMVEISEGRSSELEGAAKEVNKSEYNIKNRNKSEYNIEI
jgi:hypothetical protein